MKYRICKHARKRMRRRGITPAKVRKVLKNGQIDKSIHAGRWAGNFRKTLKKGNLRVVVEGWTVLTVWRVYI